MTDFCLNVNAEKETRGGGEKTLHISALIWSSKQKACFVLPAEGICCQSSTEASSAVIRVDFVQVSFCF